MRSRRSDTWHRPARFPVQAECGRSQARADVGVGVIQPEPSRAGAARHVKASAQEEEPSFWIMAAVCEKLYCGIFSETLWGAAGLLPVGH